MVLRNNIYEHHKEIPALWPGITIKTYSLLKPACPCCKRNIKAGNPEIIIISIIIPGPDPGSPTDLLSCYSDPGSLAGNIQSLSVSGS